MSICIKCGRENDSALCNKCKSKVDIEELCNEIIRYNFDEGDNPTFEFVANQMGSLIEFRNLVFELTEDMKAPKKELLRVNAITNNGKYWSVRNDRKDEFYKDANICVNSKEIEEKQKDTILCILFNCNLKDYNYEEAEKIATILKTKKNLNGKICYLLGDFYIKTRRYDLAKFYLEKSKEDINDADGEEVKTWIQNKFDEIEKRASGKIKEYIPASEENQEKYRTFMKNINLDIDLQESKIPKKITRKMIEETKIPDEEYPDLKENEISNNDFNTFVAFDLETTGVKQYDEIIEIGAIRVVNGKINESAKFIFEELVHPDKKRVSKEIETVTGINNEMLLNKRKIWEVFPDFMEFVKDDILVGFNCMSFDRRFLRKAGRYTNIIIKNQIYDIQKNLKKFNIEKMKLVELSKELKIETPLAHRALADAVTTAKVFMKLKELNNNIGENSAEEKLSRIKITGGRNQQGDSINEIWENLIEDCDEKDERVIRKIIENIKEDSEKPIYNAKVEALNLKTKITVNELWEKSKVMLFLSDNIENFEKAQKTGWKCYLLDDNINIDEFLERIEM